jgi:hypothetical protein
MHTEVSFGKSEEKRRLVIPKPDWEIDKNECQGTGCMD